MENKKIAPEPEFGDDDRIETYLACNIDEIVDVIEARLTLNHLKKKNHLK